ncbi:MerR family transcriptional regulator [Streptomyces sp. S07_1.15]|uniref:MerR family transcriptional regulator n=1 Tax=Streptomyces sp. S07_1.15 TaxID=2873925 RepID=UPI001D15C274|nr:MerR family transcriptional regulator [Streptomyces sp. S07_1.15]MCC3652852.1 MerR family transcriptional regulator [Streptomyces sp. S07_1.15]
MRGGGPGERSPGGFRLRTGAEVRRPVLVRRMRPLGFCLEDVRRLLNVLGQLPDTGGPLPATGEQAHEELVTTLRKYWERADARGEDLRGELRAAEDFAGAPHGRLPRLPAASAASRKAVR